MKEFKILLFSIFLFFFFVYYEKLKWIEKNFILSSQRSFSLILKSLNLDSAPMEIMEIMVYDNL